MLNEIHSRLSAGRRALQRRIGQAGHALIICCAGAAGLTGCTVRPAQVEGTVVYEYPVVEANIVPTEVAAAPRVYFHDRYVYLIEGRWYYPTSEGWLMLEEEPRELYRYRIDVRPRQPHPPLRAPAAPRREYPTPPREYPTPPPRRGP